MATAEEDEDADSVDWTVSGAAHVPGDAGAASPPDRDDASPQAAEAEAQPTRPPHTPRTEAQPPLAPLRPAHLGTDPAGVAAEPTSANPGGSDAPSTLPSKTGAAAVAAGAADR